MSDRSFVLIANPHAGRGQAARIVVETDAALSAAGVTAHAELTTSIHHARDLADQAAAVGSIAVAIGGDGLLRAVAAGASRHGGTVGIVPCGRGNDYARMVGSGALDGCVWTLLHAEPRPTDCIAVTPGLVEESDAVPYDVAIGNVYVGFDSLSNALANKITMYLGPLSYKYTALRVALTMRPLMFRLVIDGAADDYPGSGVVIANSAFYGRGVPVAPGADIHDGMLDVIMFEQVDRRSRVAMMLALRTGKHLARTDVRHVRARRIQVELEPPVEAYSDGDPICPTPLTAWVLPGAVGLLRP